MQNKRKNNAATAERSIDIVRLFRVLLKRAWIILLAAALCAGVVFCCTEWFVKDTYRSGFTAYINNKADTPEGQESMSTSDIAASRNLTYLYKEIILSRKVLLSAAEHCGIQKSYATLRNNVEVSVAANAAIIDVYVTATTRAEAQRLAAAIAEVAPTEVKRVVEASSMKVVDDPVEPSGRYAPTPRKNALLAFLISVVIGSFLAIIIDMVSDKVASPAEMEERYGIAVIGIIPDMQQADKYQQGGTEPARRK